MLIRILIAAFCIASASAVRAQSAAPGTGTAAPTPVVETVEQRLRRLEDKDAIRDIIETYAVKLTSRDIQGYVELFAPEGTWRNGNTVKRGRGEIRQLLLGMFPNTPAGYVNQDSYMLVSDIQITVAGDRATATSRQLSIIRGKDGGPTPVLAGRYEDEFIRQDGRWKILHRNDITFIPTPEIWARKMKEGILTPEGK